MRINIFPHEERGLEGDAEGAAEGEAVHVLLRF